MRNVRFTVETSDLGTGIVPNIFKNVGWDSYIPTTRPGHDLIDHTTKESGEVWQEFRALGAFLFVSQFGKNLPKRMGSNSHHVILVSESLAADLESTYSDANAWEEFINLPETPNYYLTKREGKFFQMLFDSLDKIIEEDKDEEDGHESYWNLGREYTGEDKRRIQDWLKYGYFNAKRRYKGEFASADYTKTLINEAVTKAMRTLEDYADTGEEFTLSYDVENCYVTINHKHGLI